MKWKINTWKKSETICSPHAKKNKPQTTTHIYCALIVGSNSTFLFLRRTHMLFVFFFKHRKSRWAKWAGRKTKSDCKHTIQPSEDCNSGLFYTHLITCSNRFSETPSPFEDTPTTHVIWLVFYMRYQPRPIMRADQNVPVIWWGGDSLRWNHKLGQLKTDLWISGCHSAL